jgi:hypothetical protein
MFVADTLNRIKDIKLPYRRPKPKGLDPKLEKRLDELMNSPKKETFFYHHKRYIM